jgi:hypothetical protein
MESNDILYSFIDDLYNSINDLENNDSYCKRILKKQKINNYYYISNIIIEDSDEYEMKLDENHKFQRKPYKKWGLKK